MVDCGRQSQIIVTVGLLAEVERLAANGLEAVSVEAVEIMIYCFN